MRWSLWFNYWGNLSDYQVLLEKSSNFYLVPTRYNIEEQQQAHELSSVHERPEYNYVCAMFSYSFHHSFGFYSHPVCLVESRGMNISAFHFFLLWSYLWIHHQLLLRVAAHTDWILNLPICTGVVGVLMTSLSRWQERSGSWPPKHNSLSSLHCSRKDRSTELQGRLMKLPARWEEYLNDWNLTNKN